MNTTGKMADEPLRYSHQYNPVVYAEDEQKPMSTAGDARNLHADDIQISPTGVHEPVVELDETTMPDVVPTPDSGTRPAGTNNTMDVMQDLHPPVSQMDADILSVLPMLSNKKFECSMEQLRAIYRMAYSRRYWDNHSFQVGQDEEPSFEDIDRKLEGARSKEDTAIEKGLVTQDTEIMVTPPSVTTGTEPTWKATSASSSQPTISFPPSRSYNNKDMVLLLRRSIEEIGKVVDKTPDTMGGKRKSPDESSRCCSPTPAEQQQRRKRIRRPEPTDKTPHTPTDKDIKLGRGKKRYDHPGNKVLRKHVAKLKAQYHKLDTNDDKTRMINSVVDWVHKKKGGQFIKEEGDIWFVVSPITAHEKVSQDFRG